MQCSCWRGIHIGLKRDRATCDTDGTESNAGKNGNEQNGKGEAEFHDDALTSTGCSQSRLPAIAVPVFGEARRVGAEVITQYGRQMAAMRARPFGGEHHVVVSDRAERPRIGGFLTHSMPELEEADRAVASQGVHVTR